MNDALTILRRVAACFGGELPRSYFITDLETTGFKKEDDLIVQTGYCEVVDTQPQYYETITLNWVGHPAVDLKWLRRKLELVKIGMEANGSAWHGVTIEKMKEEGKPPEEVLEDLLARLVKARKAKQPIVGHGIWQFDRSRIEYSLREWIGAIYTLSPKGIIDTALIEKALECGIVPTKEETAPEFFQRMNGTRRAGISFKMDACIERYSFDKNYELDLNESHTAGFDSLCCCYLIETYRAMMNGTQPV